MATYDLKYPGAAIDAILDTAYHLQQAGYIFRGSASDYSGTPTEREWVIAPAGFTGLGLSSAVPQGSIGICLYNGTAWVGKIINVLTLDSGPTRNSQNGVTSGGVAATLDEITSGIMDTFASLLFDDETATADLSTKLSYAVKFSVSDVYQTVTHLNILAATTSKAGLLSAADKVKIDSFLTNLRSLTFADTTASADQGTQITETLKATIGGVQEVIDSITLLAATSSKAGLLSASDKAYIDALPATLTSLSNSISGALALMQSLVGYYVCDTAAGTDAKTVAATGYSLTNGGCIRIKMTNANTADNVTLNINSTGAKSLYYDGAQASASNTWEAGEVLEVYYDGTQYQCASGGGGKFATGENVQDVSITNSINANSDDLVKGGAIYSALGEKIDKKAIDKYLVSAGGVAEAKTVGNIVGVEVVEGDEVTVTTTSGAAITNTNTVRNVSGFIYVHNLDVSSYDMLRVQCQPSGWSCLLAMDENYNILYTYTNISTLTNFDFNVASEGIKYLSISSRTTIAVHEITYTVGARIDDIEMKASESYNSLIGVTPTYISGKYLSSNGNTLYLAGSYVSDFIAIPNGLTSFLYKGHRVGSAVNAAFWSDRTQTAFASVQVDANSNDYQIITIPSGALYMKVCSTDSIPQILTTLSSLVSYYMGYLDNYLHPNHLYGKVIVGLGDSEMAGQGRTPYCKLIADRNKMTFYNHGVGGQRITETASDDNLSLIESDAYYVIVQIGYNDPQNPTYLDDATSDDSTDTTTFKGAFNHIVDYVQTNRPTARLGFVLPRYYEDDSTPQNHEWHYATSMWMAKRARILHIPFFDETANSGMSYSIAAQRQLYFGDYVHLTNEGMERISYPIEQWLRGL